MLSVKIKFYDNIVQIYNKMEYLELFVELFHTGHPNDGLFLAVLAATFLEQLLRRQDEWITSCNITFNN